MMGWGAYIGYDIEAAHKGLWAYKARVAALPKVAEAVAAMAAAA
jgi:hypothetical protein